MVNSTPTDAEKPKEGFLRCDCGRFAAIGVFYDSLNFRCWECADGEAINFVSKHIRPDKVDR